MEMSKDTPATELLLRELIANADGAEKLMGDIAREPSLYGQVKRVLDIRYGLGVWAQRALGVFGDVQITGYESDEATAKKAYRGIGVRLHPRAFDKTLWYLCAEPTDLLLADFNTCTVIQREALDEAIEAAQPRLVIFTDVAKSKLHMNYLAYGLSEPTQLAYWKGFRIDGYEYVRCVRKQRNATQALYKRRTPVG